MKPRYLPGGVRALSRGIERLVRSEPTRGLRMTPSKPRQAFFSSDSIGADVRATLRQSSNGDATRTTMSRHRRPLEPACARSFVNSPMVAGAEADDKVLSVKWAHGGQKDGLTVHVTWSGDGHRSSYSAVDLEYQCFDRFVEEKQKSPNEDFKFHYVDYEKVTNPNDDQGQVEWLSIIMTHGLCIVRNVPKSAKALEDLVELIGPISHSYLYGRTFEVKSEENPVNIAYTDFMLEPHLDLAYYESPPGLQFLHCLEAGEGGESTFVDTYDVAEQLRTTSPASFEILGRVPATFQKIHFQRENPAYMEYRRPHIVVDSNNQVTSVFWSPPFEGPLRASVQDTEAYIQAYRVFHGLINSSSNVKEVKLLPGDVVAFNQRSKRLLSTHYDSEEAVLQQLRRDIEEEQHRFRRANSTYDDSMHLDIPSDFKVGSGQPVAAGKKRAS